MRISVVHVTQYYGLYAVIFTMLIRVIAKWKIPERYGQESLHHKKSDIHNCTFISYTAQETAINRDCIDVTTASSNTPEDAWFQWNARLL